MREKLENNLQSLRKENQIIRHKLYIQQEVINDYTNIILASCINPYDIRELQQRTLTSIKNSNIDDVDLYLNRLFNNYTSNP